MSKMVSLVVKCNYVQVKKTNLALNSEANCFLNFAEKKQNIL